LSPSLRYRTDASGKAVTGGLEDYFDVVPAKTSEAPRADTWNHAESFGTNGLSLVTRETRHVPGKPSMSLEIGLGSKDASIAWWSGDSIVDHDRLIAVSSRATILFHDCTFVDQPGQVHGTFSELRKLPLSVREKVVLMHHDDDLEQHRPKALDLGFRVLLPGEVYDLASGQLRAPVKSASSQA
jgi:hypothetical protein